MPPRQNPEEQGSIELPEAVRLADSEIGDERDQEVQRDAEVEVAHPRDRLTPVRPAPIEEEEHGEAQRAERPVSERSRSSGVLRTASGP